MKLDIYYDENEKNNLLNKPTYLENYSRRIPDDFEDLSIETSKDHLNSLDSKYFYFKIDGEKDLKSSRIKLNGLNNLWLDENTKILKI